MKVLSVFGTRPEAIKMAPVIHELQRFAGRIESTICVTGQHRHMLDQVLSLFGLRTDFDLAVMRPDQSLSQVTARILTELDKVVQSVRPDWLLVQGDTTTAMVAALVAFYHRVRVGHVEAGLRTGNRYHPFPEEINRKIADALTDLYFAPTEWARQNLHKEGVPDSAIHVTGNTVVDALHSIAAQPPDQETHTLLKQLGFRAEAEPAGSRHPFRLILVTAHRRENFGGGLENICAALKQLAAVHGTKVQIVYPVHLNPNVQRPVQKLLQGIPNIHLLPPLSYAPLVHLLKRSYLVLTDSGGLQEEAPTFGVPVLVMRETTERPEAITGGTAILVGTDSERIIKEATLLLENPEAYQSMSRRANPFGDGQASQRIIQALLAAEPAPVRRGRAALECHTPNPRSTPSTT